MQIEEIRVRAGPEREGDAAWKVVLPTPGGRRAFACRLGPAFRARDSAQQAFSCTARRERVFWTACSSPQGVCVQGWHLQQHMSRGSRITVDERVLVPRELVGARSDRLLRDALGHQAKAWCWPREGHCQQRVSALEHVCARRFSLARWLRGCTFTAGTRQGASGTIHRHPRVGAGRRLRALRCCMHPSRPSRTGGECVSPPWYNFFLPAR